MVYWPACRTWPSPWTSWAWTSGRPPSWTHGGWTSPYPRPSGRSWWLRAAWWSRCPSGTAAPVVGRRKWLQPHICDRWVCGTETTSSMPMPDFNLLCYIAECGLSGPNQQAHNLIIWMVASDLPWAPSCVRLPIEPALFAFSKTAHGKKLGESALKG